MFSKATNYSDLVLSNLIENISVYIFSCWNWWKQISGSRDSIPRGRCTRFQTFSNFTAKLIFTFHFYLVKHIGQRTGSVYDWRRMSGRGYARYIEIPLQENLLISTWLSGCCHVCLSVEGRGHLSVKVELVWHWTRLKALTIRQPYLYQPHTRNIV